MNHHLPRVLVRTAAFLAVLTFTVAMYLEGQETDWLGSHPISANLISAFICFNFGIVFLSRILRWFVEQDKVRELNAPVKVEWDALIQMHRPAWNAVIISEIREAFARKGISTREIDPDFPVDCAPHSNARAALSIFSQNPPPAVTWRKVTAQFRWSGLRFLAAARDLADRYGIDDPATLGRLDRIHAIVTALPEGGSSNELQPYLVARARLEGLTYLVVGAHWRMMKARVKSERGLETKVD